MWEVQTPGPEGQGMLNTPKAGEATAGQGWGPSSPSTGSISSTTTPSQPQQTHTHITSSSLHSHWTRDTLIYLSVIRSSL